MNQSNVAPLGSQKPPIRKVVSCSARPRRTHTSCSRASCVCVCSVADAQRGATVSGERAGFGTESAALPPVQQKAQVRLCATNAAVRGPCTTRALWPRAQGPRASSRPRPVPVRAAPRANADCASHCAATGAHQLVLLQCDGHCTNRPGHRAPWAGAGKGPRRRPTPRAAIARRVAATASAQRATSSVTRRSVQTRH